MERIRGDGTMRSSTILRLSEEPDVFLLRGFLGHDECESVITAAAEGRAMNRRGGGSSSSNNNNNSDDAKYSGGAMMEQAGTESGCAADAAEQRKGCGVAWLPTGHDDVTRAITSSSGALLLAPEAKAADAEKGVSVEPLQVLRYADGGRFHLHVDPVPGAPRCLTVIYYLNGVAGTWFPFAREGRGQLQLGHPRDKQSALDLARDLVPGTDGLLITSGNSSSSRRSTSTSTSTSTSISTSTSTDTSSRGGNNVGDGTAVVPVQRGDAVAFYSYGPGGDVDWRAMHAGLPTCGTKWIANHWFHAGWLKAPSPAE